MAHPYKNSLADQRFGRLFVGPPLIGTGRWWCWCDCGEVVTPQRSDLISGNVKSCGCLNRDVRAARFLIHGASRRGKITKEFEAWKNMLSRCNYPSYVGYENYGGRGIKVCDRWQESFENFLEDMGPRPEGGSLERKDVNGHYEPDNCIWLPRPKQSWNRRNTIRITRDGETLPLKIWAERLGISYATAMGRHRRGYPVEKLLMPVGSFQCSKDWVRQPSSRSAS